MNSWITKQHQGPMHVRVQAYVTGRGKKYLYEYIYKHKD